MPIHYEMVAEVSGKYLQGEIRNGKYKFNELIHTNKKNLTSHEIRDIISELEELAKLVEAQEIIDVLAPKENDPHENSIDFEILEDFEEDLNPF